VSVDQGLEALDLDVGAPRRAIANPDQAEDAEELIDRQRSTIRQKK
jgi:hypothetical protein